MPNPKNSPSRFVPYEQLDDPRPKHNYALARWLLNDEKILHHLATNEQLSEACSGLQIALGFVNLDRDRGFELVMEAAKAVGVDVDQALADMM